MKGRGIAPGNKMNVVFGRAADELFINFVQAKENRDLNLARSVMDNLNSLSDGERQELTGLYMDVEEYINELELEEEELVM